MVLYQIPSLDPGRAVAVGWDPRRGGYVARVDGAGAGDSRVVTWVGTRHPRLRTVWELQRAIRGYAVIRADVLAALEADQASGDGAAAAAVLTSGPLGAAAGGARNGHPAPPPERRGGRPLRTVLLAVLALVVAAVAVVVLQAVWPGP
jgi:hypothetical protein